MLTNYDARAVAQVMGIAFLAADRARSRSSEPVGDVLGTPFDIDVGGSAVRVVQAMTRRAVPAGGPAGPDSEQSKNPILSAVMIEKAVEHGLPRHALRHVAEALAGGDKSKVAAIEWGVVPKTTLDRRVTQLSPQESERTERVARLFVQARRALGSEAEARDFMMAPHPELEGRSPVEVSRTDLGTRRAERILTALEYGLAL
jgi:putative toxin-antitoxin system antitoxin component (TIGR02293 family)